MAQQTPEDAPRIDTPLPTYANMKMYQKIVPTPNDPKAGTRRLI